MSARLKAPVLTVDAAEMRKVDPRNVETLFGMWTVFSRCAEAMEEGRRYENLSWRLWNRETFCCTSAAASSVPTATSTPTPRSIRPEESSFSSSSSPSSSPSAHRSRARSRIPSSPHASSGPSSPRLRRALTDDLPELSISVDSAVSERDDDTVIGTTTTAPALGSPSTLPLDIERPAIRRLDSFESRGRGHERHLTSLHLERMFSSIKACKELAPLTWVDPGRTLIVRPCTAEVPPLGPEATTTRPSDVSAVRLDDDDVPASVARRSTQSTSLHRRASPGSSAVEEAGVKPNMFQLGPSSAEDDCSLDDHMGPTPPQSTLPARGALVHATKPTPSADRKQTSFSDEVVTRTIREEVHHLDPVTDDEDVDDDDDDDEDVSESAIEDDDDDDDDMEEVDDSSDWDSVTESGPSSLVDEKPLFPRLDATRTLTSHRSLLTNLLHQSQRASAFAEVAARSTPAAMPSRTRSSAPAAPTVVPTAVIHHGDDDDDGGRAHEAAIDDDDDDEADPVVVVLGRDPTRRRRGPGRPPPPPPPDPTRSRPIIMTTSNGHPPALSPRTTRRNMLATELTESLRKHLLWERQQKHMTVHGAVLKRRHTSHDVAHLNDYPPEPTSRAAAPAPSSTNHSWNHYYFDLGLGEYHQKGW